MNARLDYKATIWFKIPLNSDDAVTIAKRLIEENTLPSELYNVLTDKELGQCEPLYETEEFLTAEENDSQATIEIYNEYNKLVWDNSYQSELRRKENE